MEAGHTILLIEDTENDALLMTRALEKSGLDKQVQLARDGKEALECLTGTGAFADRRAFPPPRLILLDLQLPQMHGLKVLEWVRSEEHTSELQSLRHLVCRLLLEKKKKWTGCVLPVMTRNATSS